ncbi:hypothetical protein N7528_008531 [Penicillium herquei]|nr:hypothetical protein N7528_008531 [Penicillium herquei]
MVHILADAEALISCLLPPPSAFTNRRWMCCGVLAGSLSGLCLLLGLVAAMLLPPVRPSQDAITVHDFYHHHRAGCAAGALLLMVSGFLYVPYAAVISHQMRLIPTLDPAIPSLQLAISTASVLGFVVPAFFLAVITFRDYGAELTLLLSDLFWITLVFPWIPFWIQGWTIAWASFSDSSDNPIFPKSMGLVNFIAPLFLASSSGVHVKTTGLYAWDSHLVWIGALVAIGVQYWTDTTILWHNIRHRPELQRKTEPIPYDDAQGTRPGELSTV